MQKEKNVEGSLQIEIGERRNLCLSGKGLTELIPLRKNASLENEEDHRRHAQNLGVAKVQRRGRGISLS